MRVLQADPDVPAPDVLAAAKSVLERDGLLIYPTDTLYALGGRALSARACQRVRAAKRREEGKPLPVIASDGEQARGLGATWPVHAERLAAAFWPGPLTLVIAATPSLPDALHAGTGTVAVRVPALALARALCASAGPLVATSANLSGEPAPLTCADAVRAVGRSAAIALDGGPGQPLPSTIVDLTGPEPRLLRAGPVSWDDVRRVCAVGP